MKRDVLIASDEYKMTAGCAPDDGVVSPVAPGDPKRWELVFVNVVGEVAYWTWKRRAPTPRTGGRK